jgi:uncharacterized protein (TIGR00369 family)
MSVPNPDNPCFGCGGANPHGMRLVFEPDEQQQRVRGRFRLGREFQGGPGFIHGGIIATVLDEAMGKVNRFHGVTAVTAELNIQYHRPIRVDEEIVVEASHVERNGRQLWHAGEIRNAAGQVLAKGKGRFVAIDPGQFLK